MIVIIGEDKVNVLVIRHDLGMHVVLFNLLKTPHSTMLKLKNERKPCHSVLLYASLLNNA